MDFVPKKITKRNSGCGLAYNSSKKNKVNVGSLPFFPDGNSATFFAQGLEVPPPLWSFAYQSVVCSFVTKLKYSFIFFSFHAIKDYTLKATFRLDSVPIVSTEASSPCAEIGRTLLEFL